MWGLDILPHNTIFARGKVIAVDLLFVGMININGSK
jgi:hypothetical protein